MAKNVVVKNLSSEDDAMKKKSHVNRKVNFVSSKCSTCSLKYNEDRLQRNMKCGHSICTKCADSYVYSQMSCSECLVKQTCQRVSAFNYPMINFITSFYMEKIFNETELPPIHTNPIDSCSNYDDAHMCTTHGSTISFVCCSCSTLACKECLEEDHYVVPHGNCKILGVNDTSDRLRKVCQKETKQMFFVIEGYRKMCELDLGMHAFCLEHDAFHRRTRDQFIQETGGLLEDLTKNTASLVENAKDKVKKIENSIKINNSLKEMVMIAVEIDAYDRELRQNIERERKAFPSWTKLMKPYIRTALKQLVEKKIRVYALQETDTETRWAPITIKNDCLLLYSLREGVTPSEGFTIPYQYVRLLIPKLKTTVFFEIETKGVSTGIVYIRLFDFFTQDVKQMELMCSGEMGVSYRGTCFFKHSEEDGFLQGGDYENNDGTGGKPIVETLGHVMVGSLHSSGTGLLIGDGSSTKFRICLKEGIRVSGLIGKVMDGIDILKAASKNQVLMKTGIKDCGLLVPISVVE